MASRSARSSSRRSAPAKGIGILAAIIILLVAFGSLIAMGLPIVTALFGIGVGVAVVSLLSRWLIVPSFGTELAAMIGIGVGIDYALFIVTRYRQGLAEGRDPRAAVIRALDTSGRAVLFAGCTVVISLLGMLLLGQPFVYGLAFGAIAGVLLVMSASLTLLPALLGFTGTKIDRLAIPFLHQDADPGHNRHSFWYRWSRVIQRHPWPAALGSLAILLVLALPVFSLQMLFSDAGNDSTALTTRHAYDLLAEGFGPGTNGPLVIAVGKSPDAVSSTGPGGEVQAITSGADKVVAALRTTPGIAVVAPPQVSQSGNAAVIIVVPKTSPQSGKTEALVHHLRGQVIPTATAGTNVQALVGGFTAAGIDSAANFSHRLIWVIGAVVLFSFLLLMAVFRSIAVPIKAAIMNLLSIGAAYGVTVAVFQWGWLGGPLHIGQTGPIDPWIPLMLFTILFGLSMDYEVFLLSRIREEWLRTGDNGTAVADGLAQTARVITAAAAIMFCVFGSFVIGDLRVLKVFGLGLAVAVLIDATHRAHGAGARHDGAARQGQLVVPALARPHRAQTRRRGRDRARHRPRPPRDRARARSHPRLDPLLETGHLCVVFSRVSTPGSGGVVSQGRAVPPGRRIRASTPPPRPRGGTPRTRASGGTAPPPARHPCPRAAAARW